MNPFTELDVRIRDEAQAYDNARQARLAEQLHVLRTERRLSEDKVLSRVLAGCDDPRCSLIFMARPSEEIIRMIQSLQERIQKIVPSAWITPSEDLHMTLLDVKSCVAEDVIEPMIPLFKNFVVPSCRIELSQPRLMLDQRAGAVTFTPNGHIRFRRALWDACAAIGQVPDMRYVSLSAHVTIFRFTEDETLSTDTVKDLIDLVEQSLTGDWTIDSQDVKCVHGRVYYGGGTVIVPGAP